MPPNTFARILRICLMPSGMTLDTSNACEFKVILSNNLLSACNRLIMSDCLQKNSARNLKKEHFFTNDFKIILFDSK